MRLHETKTDDDLIERLRQLGAQWFKNEDLLALEELIWRYNNARKARTAAEQIHGDIK